MRSHKRSYALFSSTSVIGVLINLINEYRRKISMTKNGLDSLLRDPQRLEGVFTKLIARAKEDKSILSKKTLTRNIDLQWILYNKDKISKLILNSIKKHDYEFCGQKQITIVTDKERLIYVTNWIDKIFLMHLTAILQEYLLPQYGQNLYSFQKGKSTHL